jgi:hypothetical protein
MYCVAVVNICIKKEKNLHSYANCGSDFHAFDICDRPLLTNVV